MFKQEIIIQSKRFKNDLLLLANKLIQNLPHHCNAKENYQSFIRKKNAKSVKQLKMITYQLNTF